VESKTAEKGDLVIFLVIKQANEPLGYEICRSFYKPRSNKVLICHISKARRCKRVKTYKFVS